MAWSIGKTSTAYEKSHIFCWFENRFIVLCLLDLFYFVLNNTSVNVADADSNARWAEEVDWTTSDWIWTWTWCDRVQAARAVGEVEVELGALEDGDEGDEEEGDDILQVGDDMDRDARSSKFLNTRLVRTKGDLGFSDSWISHSASRFIR